MKRDGPLCCALGHNTIYTKIYSKEIERPRNACLYVITAFDSEAIVENE